MATRSQYRHLKSKGHVREISLLRQSKLKDMKKRNLHGRGKRESVSVRRRADLQGQEGGQRACHPRHDGRRHLTSPGNRTAVGAAPVGNLAVDLNHLSPSTCHLICDCCW
ncbi:hypothetical protein NMG60_11012635 [Bertholletia excelsa]